MKSGATIFYSHKHDSNWRGLVNAGPVYCSALTGIIKLLQDSIEKPKIVLGEIVRLFIEWAVKGCISEIQQYYIDAWVESADQPHFTNWVEIMLQSKIPTRQINPKNVIGVAN